jgi:hypothetical protein
VLAAGAAALTAGARGIDTARRQRTAGDADAEDGTADRLGDIPTGARARQFLGQRVKAPVVHGYAS